MNSRTIRILAGGFGLLVILFVLLVWRFTTYLDADLPKGILTSWHHDKVLSSGQVMQPLGFIFPHASSGFDFVRVSNMLIRYPVGVMPFFQRVDGSAYRIVVDRDIGAPVIYLIDDRAKSMVKIDSNGFDSDANITNWYAFAGVGDWIGTPMAKTNEIMRFDSDSKRIQITRDKGKEKVELVIDPLNRKVTDLRIIPKPGQP